MLSINRIAALIAVGCCPAPQHLQPVIELAHVEWAHQLVSCCVETLARRFRNGNAGTGEDRLFSELCSYVQDYIKLEPKKRKDSWRTPDKLMHRSDIIPWLYFQKRASQVSMFKNHPRGFDAALKTALDSMCKAGVVEKLTHNYSKLKYGVSRELYEIGDPNTWLDEPIRVQFFDDDDK